MLREQEQENEGLNLQGENRNKKLGLELMGYKTAILKFRTAAMFEGSQTGSVLPRTRIDMTGSEAQVSTGL